jgi:hypothetical protein
MATLLLSLGAMPTVLRTGPYRFFFYAGDRDEPEHVHVERGANKAKFWLDPVSLERSGRLDRRELRSIQSIVEAHQAELLEAWREYFQG